MFPDTAKLYIAPIADSQCYDERFHFYIDHNSMIGKYRHSVRCRLKCAACASHSVACSISFTFRLNELLIPGIHRLP